MKNQLLDYTKQRIYFGFDRRDLLIIEKETDYIFTKVLVSMLQLSEKIVTIRFDKAEFNLASDYLLSDKHRINLFKWLERLEQFDQSMSDLEFGKMKIDFEKWYDQLGGNCLEFTFQNHYLLSLDEAAELLGITGASLHKLIKQGLECVGSRDQQKIPKYVIDLMSDPVYGIKMQMLAQEKKLQNQTPLERLVEINQEISELQLKYRVLTLEEAFKGYNGDDMDDPSDYYRWLGLVGERDEIVKRGWV